MVELEIKKNARWVIDYICRIEGLTNETLAQIMGVNKGTVSNYRTMKTTPKREFVEKFYDKFNIDKDWFLNGRGEPFPGAREKYPEVCGPEKEGDLIERIAEPTVKYSAGVDDFGKAVAGLREIFDSQDPVLIPAIQANIHAFQRSVRQERHIQQQANKINTLEKENTSIKERLEAIEKRLPQTPNDEPTEKKVM
jgi:transcriptional regulator with XRE-family HTH domain